MPTSQHILVPTWQTASTKHGRCSPPATDVLDLCGALSAPQSRNHGRNHRIGWNAVCVWKRNECLGKTARREANLGGTTSLRYRVTELLPRQNNVSMAKRLPTAPASSAKKLRNSTLTPQYRAEQLQRHLPVSSELLFCKPANIQLTGSVKIHAMTTYCWKKCEKQGKVQ